jgi:methionine synthase I (cobalamin-dependent)
MTTRLEILHDARIVGGCCGTDPSYIKRMAETLKR